MKKIISFVLMVVILLTTLPAMADKIRTSGPYTYEIKGNGKIEITGYNWAESKGDIYVPNMIDGYVVSSIGDNAFNAQYDLLDLRMGRAQLYAKKQVGVTLPDSIMSIGDFAFKDANLSYINIPANVQSIGDGAFINCTAIQFKVDPNNSNFATIDGALYSKKQKELIATPITKTITIPEGIVSIRNYAFYTSAIEFRMRADGDLRVPYTLSVSLPSTLKSIGDYAFSGRGVCADGNLLPSNLTSIGVSAFEDCELGNVLIPATVSSIGQRAFANIQHATVWDVITIPSNSQLTCIPKEAFLNIPHEVKIESSNIKQVDSYAFAGLEEVIRYDYNVEIDISSTALQNIEVWGDYAFYCDTRRSKGTTFANIPTSLTISKNITTLPAGFNLLISIPEHVTEIASKAFTENVDVVDYYLPNTIMKIAVDAFPKGATFIVDAGSYAELWCKENGFGYSIKGQQDDLSWLNN